MASTAPNWHPEAIGASTAQAWDALAADGAIEDFYLAGGTALALQLGHRVSEDLDFFCAQDFDERRFLSRIRTAEDITVVSTARATLHILIAGAKVSFLGYPYPLLDPLHSYRGASVAARRDIACMKITAIASRGTRRDFIDLYAVARATGLEALLQSFQQKYAGVHYNPLHILKSLVYFEDAEREPLPNLLQSIEWAEVRKFFEDQVSLLAKDL